MHSSFSSFITTVNPIVSAIQKAGGVCYLVGGSVRDYVLNLPLKDFDIEVHKLTVEQLENCLKPFGPVKLVGKKFGVLRIDNLDVDWSLPRKDSSGRKPDVSIDPFMPIKEACRRRDLTMNAMAIDLNDIIISHKPTIIDPYGGLNDIKNKVLCAVDQTLFLEDPLRFYRVMQFIGRFDMQPDDALNNLCSTMALYDTTTNSALAHERIYEEIKKLFLRSERPSQGFRWLRAINKLNETFPELHTLIGVIQRADYHPEGDVFEHTMQTLDAAARLTTYYQESEVWGSAETEKFLIMLGALCHDLGKATTTTAEGRAHGHDKAGVPLAHTLMRRLTNNQSLEKAVAKLVQFHLHPFQFLKEKAGNKSYKRLAAKLAPNVTMRQLGLIALTDAQGRNGASQVPLDQFYEIFDQFIFCAQQANVVHKPEAPALLGRHLLDTVPAGPKLGKLLDEAYEIQIEEGITDWQELKQRVLR